MVRSSYQRCSIKKGVLRNFKKFTGKHLCQSSFLIKLQAEAQVFSCEFCNISKNTFFTEHLWTTASVWCLIWCLNETWKPTSGGHDKVIWSRERSRDDTRDETSRQRNSETWWRRTTATLFGVSFETYRRVRRDALMARSGYVTLRRLGDLPLRRHWVFHLRLVSDVVETYWWDVAITSP